MNVIRYNTKGFTEVYHSDVEAVEKQEFFVGVSMPWNEANEEIAKKEAYNGEYTIEDDGQPEPVPQQTQEERIAELEEALEMLLSGVTE